MTAPTLRPHLLAALLVGLTALPCSSAPITLDALDSGAYTAAGAHDPANENYLTGIFNGGETRSFFLFDLSSISGTIESATLRLFNPEVSQFLHGYVSPDPTETLNVYDVAAPPALLTGGSAGGEGFADLGSGTLYGSTIVSSASNGQLVDITLNAAALAALNAADGQFVLGTALGSLSGGANQYAFGFSMTSFVADHTRQLLLDVAPVAPVPEPATLALFAAGAATIGIRRLKR